MLVAAAPQPAAAVLVSDRNPGLDGLCDTGEREQPGTYAATATTEGAAVQEHGTDDEGAREPAEQGGAAGQAGGAEDGGEAGVA